MFAGQRAIAVEDKEQRRQAILDAAETLFLEQPDRMANVAEVAETAGLAKGTVYLYFASKEEMLLALHERHVTGFFTPLMEMLSRPGPVDFDFAGPVGAGQCVRIMTGGVVPTGADTVVM